VRDTEKETFNCHVLEYSNTRFHLLPVLLLLLLLLFLFLFSPRYPVTGESYRVLANLPAHAIIAVVPLVNTTEAMGPTRMLLKSHIPCHPQQKGGYVGERGV
jgi:hypothetical protein